MGPAQILMAIMILCLFVPFGHGADQTSLVYKGCADQKFQGSTGPYTQNLQALFNSLTSQSDGSKFYKTTSGDGLYAILGLYQCRGDLSAGDCGKCVRKTPEMARKLCGDAVAARVQLGGCYMRYEVAGFKQLSGTELLYKVCGSTQASGAGFGDRLDLALGEIVKGVGGNGSGFYAGGYQSVYVLGQCEGDLGSGDCVECVKNAVQKSKSECGNSINAQIYLQECYISYSYYPNGVPRESISSGTTKVNTQKTIAIVLGGIVGVGLVIACLLVTRSAFKKKNHYNKYGGY